MSVDKSRNIPDHNAPRFVKFEEGKKTLLNFGPLSKTTRIKLEHSDGTVKKVGSVRVASIEKYENESQVHIRWYEWGRYQPLKIQKGNDEVWVKVNKASLKKIKWETKESPIAAGSPLKSTERALLRNKQGNLAESSRLNDNNFSEKKVPEKKAPATSLRSTPEELNFREQYGETLDAFEMHYGILAGNNNAPIGLGNPPNTPGIDASEKRKAHYVQILVRLGLWGTKPKMPEDPYVLKIAKEFKKKINELAKNDPKKVENNQAINDYIDKIYKDLKAHDANNINYNWNKTTSDWWDLQPSQP